MPARCVRGHGEGPTAAKLGKQIERTGPGLCPRRDLVQGERVELRAEFATAPRKLEQALEYSRRRFGGRTDERVLRLQAEGMAMTLEDLLLCPRPARLRIEQQPIV